jgi:hypothetical protein
MALDNISRISRQVWLTEIPMISRGLQQERYSDAKQEDGPRAALTLIA